MLLGSIPVSGLAQEKDTIFIQQFSDTLNLRVQWVNKGWNLQIGGPGSDSLFYYGPQSRHYAGFGGFLWNIGFNFLIPLPRPLKNDHIKRFDFQGGLFAKYWLLDGIFQRYRGFYIGRSNHGLNDEPENFNNNFLAKKIQTSLTYLPNGEQLSLRAPFNQGNRQVKTAGSFLLAGGFTYIKIEDEDGIIPGVAFAQGEPILRSVRFASVTTQMGYSCNIIYQNFFIHMFGLTGLGFQQQNYQWENFKSTFSMTPMYSGRAALGFDNGKFYAGIYGMIDYASFEVERWQLDQLTSQVRIFLGIRFTEPEFIQKIKPKFLERLQNSPNIPLPPIFG